ERSPHHRLSRQTGSDHRLQRRRRLSESSLGGRLYRLLGQGGRLCCAPTTDDGAKRQSRHDKYDRCKDRSEVVLYAFVNGTHEWPKPQNNDHFNATDAIWEFFV